MKVASFSLSISATTGSDYISYLRRNLSAAHRLLDNAPGEISLALIGNVRMSSLHWDYMKIPGPTDVITFPLEVDDDGSVRAGEIVVCVPVAVRKARRMRTEPRRELLLYALHGMLHLSGFDDRTPTGYRIMHRMEDAVLTRLGLGPQFARPAPPSRRRRGA